MSTFKITDFNFTLVESRNSQKLLKSSDTDEARIRKQNMGQMLTSNDQVTNSSSYYSL